MRIQHDQLRGRGVFQPRQPDPTEVHQQPRGGQRDRRDPAGLPPEGQKGRGRRLGPVLPDLRRELPRGLHLLFLQLEQDALRQRGQPALPGVHDRPADRAKAPERQGQGQGRQVRRARLLAGPVLGHAAHPVVPEPGLPDDLRRTPDRPGGPAAAGPVPDRPEEQGDGTARRYDRHAPRLHVPPGHEGVLLDLPPGRRRLRPEGQRPEEPQLPADRQRPGDGEHHRRPERADPEPSRDEGEPGAGKERPCEHHR